MTVETGNDRPLRGTNAERLALTELTKHLGRIFFETDTNDVYWCDGAAWHQVNGAGGGDVATDAIWDAAGDLAVGTGADTAAKLSVGADGTVLTVDPATHVPAWQALPALADHDHSGDAGDGGTFDAANLTTGASGDGQVLTSDGLGGAAWEDIPAQATQDHDHSGDAGDGNTFDAANLTSGASTDGQVLTSDGAGGAAWESIADAHLVDYSAGDVSNPPRAVELTALLGSPLDLDAGYTAILNDAGAGLATYLVGTDGLRWWYVPLARASALIDATDLTEIDHRHVTTPDTYGTGIALGNLNVAAGLELVVGSGEAAGGTGHVRCFDAAGNTLWTYHAANSAYAMGVDIGDIDEDGDNEVAVGYNVLDHCGLLLDKAGNLVWSFDTGVGTYTRCARIGKLRNDYTGKQAVFAGYDGTLALVDKDGNAIWNKTGVTSLCSPACSHGSPHTVQSVDIADTDSDGQAEILIGYNICVRKYDETGTQTWSTDIGNVGDGTTGSYVWGVTAGKVTSATGLQIAAAVGDLGSGGVNKASLLDKDGAELWHWDCAEPCWSVATGDVNGDGYAEVIVGYGTYPSGSGGVAVLDGTGALLDSVTLTQPVKFIKFGDVNNDGIDEIIASCDDGQVHIIAGAATAALTDTQKIVVYNDTQVNVEAGGATLSEMRLARDSGTDNLGFYIGGTWYWINIAGYQLLSEKGAVNGYAELDGAGLVPADQLGTGTPDGTKFLRDDRQWTTPPSIAELLVDDDMNIVFDDSGDVIYEG